MNSKEAIKRLHNLDVWNGEWGCYSNLYTFLPELFEVIEKDLEIFDAFYMAIEEAEKDEEQLSEKKRISFFAVLCMFTVCAWSKSVAFQIVQRQDKEANVREVVRQMEDNLFEYFFSKGI